MTLGGTAVGDLPSDYNELFTQCFYYSHLVRTFTVRQGTTNSVRDTGLLLQKGKMFLSIY